MSKKTFRLEDGTQVTSDIMIQKAYTSRLNNENYQERTQNEHACFSLDDETAPDVPDKTDVENDVERREEVRLLHQAIGELSVRERDLLLQRSFTEAA